MYWRTAVLFHEDHRGGALCGQHSEDRVGGKSVLRCRSVPPPLPSETSHPSTLIQAGKRLRRVVGSECLQKVGLAVIYVVFSVVHSVVL